MLLTLQLPQHRAGCTFAGMLLSTLRTVSAGLEGGQEEAKKRKRQVYDKQWGSQRTAGMTREGGGRVGVGGVMAEAYAGACDG